MNENPFINITVKKLNLLLKEIEDSQDDLKTKTIKKTLFNRYYEANIPVEYWTLNMKDFKGSNSLNNFYKEYAENIKTNYINGKSNCLAGTHGVGKTFTSTALLKIALKHNYSALYTTLSEVVSLLTQAPNEKKYDGRVLLNTIDFLVLDEFDNRFMSTENSVELYGRTLESVFRTRSQNKLPTIMCTNSPNISEIFSGPLKDSLSSLMAGYLKVLPIFGEDFRKKELNG